MTTRQDHRSRPESTFSTGCCIAALLVVASSGALDAQRPTAAAKDTPPESGALDRAIDRGVDFILATQNKDGSWGSARNTKGLNIYAPAPGAHHAFRAAVTALCVSALIDVEASRPEAARALDRAEAWLFQKLPSLRRATPDAIYNVWGHAYAIRALVRLRRLSPEDGDRRAEIDKQIRGQIDALARYESIDGGWGYYDFSIGTQRPTSSPTSFTTATVLIALDEARRIGIAAPEKMVRRALDSIRRQQKPDFSYLYGEYLKWRPMRLVNRRAASLGRSQACNLALRVWGDEAIDDRVLETWLERLHARNLWLDIGRKRPIPHESWFQVAGYFFYYGHYYAALCIEELEPRRQSRYREQLAGILLPLQEKDGSWWDFPLYDYHRQYGTAYAVMALARCRGAQR